MHLLIIPVEELKEAREIKDGLQTLLPEVLLLNATEGSLELLRRKCHSEIPLRNRTMD